MSKVRIRDTEAIHQAYLAGEYGAATPGELQRLQDDAVLFAGRTPVPIVSGRWDIGDAQRSLLTRLVELGLIQDETELGDAAESGAYGPSPGVAALAAAGATPTIALVGNDTDGQITLTPNGAGIAAGSIITVTFAIPRASASYNVFISMNSNGARALGTGIGPTSRSTTAFSLDTRTALTAGTSYIWGYQVAEFEY